MSTKHSHCSHCGSQYVDLSWPRKCVRCEQLTWDNPIPVGVVLVPLQNVHSTRDGVLLISRGENPGKGKLALPGGHLESGETWQVGCARELEEEVGLKVDPKELELFDLVSTPGNMLIVFAKTKTRTYEEVWKGFKNNHEVEYIAQYNEPIELAFPSHTAVMKKFFGR